MSTGRIPRADVGRGTYVAIFPTYSRCQSAAAMGTNRFKWCCVEAVDEGLAERPCNRQERVDYADLLPDHNP